MPPQSGDNPIPLTPAQLTALFSAASLQLRSGLRAVSQEIAVWRRYAAQIPRADIRDRALDSLNSKRGHIDGAALFWILAPRPDLALLRVLVAYDVLCDYLDSLTEPPHFDALEAERLHVAMTDALQPGLKRRAYVPRGSVRDDAGYLDQLVATCQRGCAGLPSFATAQPYALREAARASVVLPANHLPPAERDRALQRWATSEFPAERTLFWFELSAAASTWLAVQAALALAAHPRSSATEIAATCDAYFPWCSLAGTMLDSYVDEAEDAKSGNHRYVGHYPTPSVMVERVSSAINRSAWALRNLALGHRHCVIFSCMVAMYLSKDSAREPALRASTSRLAASGGTLSQVLVPILRAWRLRYQQRDA